MKWYVRNLVVASITGLAAAAAAAPPPPPSLIGSGADATYVVDEATGDLTTIADPAGGPTATPELAALATDGAGNVWGIDLGDAGKTQVQLISIDATGHVSSAKTMSYLGQPVGLAESLSFAPNGALWVGFHWDGDLDFFRSGHLGVVDPATGVIDPATVVKLSGGTQDDADMIEFVGHTLFVGDNLNNIGTTLFTADLSTGALTQVGPIQDNNTFYEVADLAWDGTRLFGETFTGFGNPGSGRLIEIDVGNGAATLVGPVGGRTILDGLTRAGRMHHHGGGGGDDDDDDDGDDGHHHKHHKLHEHHGCDDHHRHWRDGHHD